METKVLQVNHLKKYFPVKIGHLHAVDDVNFSIAEGKTLGVVGESGCGKTTLGKVVLGLMPVTSGDVYFYETNLTELNSRQLHAYRRDMQIIFQDPYASLNPRHTVSQIIGEAMLVNKIIPDKQKRKARTKELMDIVGLSQRFFESYPHELDGGRRQRIGIARAISVNPKLIICDEPVSALDVSIQAQIINLLMDLQAEFNLTYMFITHNLSVVKHISDEIMVMYLGQCVERCESDELFTNPLHPYTRALLSAIPIPSAEARNVKTEIIRGELSSPVNPKPGCRFLPRCPHSTDACANDSIPLKEVCSNHFVACIQY